MTGTVTQPAVPSLEHLLPAAAHALAGELGRSPGELRVVSGARRSYSHTWEIEAASGRYFLKWLPMRAARELELARLCRRLFEGEPAIRTPRIACNPTPDTFLVEKLPGIPLHEACTTPPLLGLAAWTASRRLLLGRVGAWLDGFHRAAPPGAPGPLAGVKRYVRNREAAFDALEQDLADQLLRALEAASTDGAVRVHGDFTPHNILVAGDTIAVIDFAGVSELEVETRCFDAAAMVVGLEETWRFRGRNHLRFFPSTANEMIAAFLQASGVARDDAALPLCYAVRHLTRAYNILRRTGKPPGPRSWHVQRLRLALERPEAIRQMVRRV